MQYRKHEVRAPRRCPLKLLFDQGTPAPLRGALPAHGRYAGPQGLVGEATASCLMWRN